MHRVGSVTDIDHIVFTSTLGKNDSMVRPSREGNQTWRVATSVSSKALQSFPIFRGDTQCRRGKADLRSIPIRRSRGNSECLQRRSLRQRWRWKRGKFSEKSNVSNSNQTSIQDKKQIQFFSGNVIGKDVQLLKNADGIYLHDGAINKL